MIGELGAKSVFLPAFAVVFLTFIAFMRMEAANGTAMKAAKEGLPEPEVTLMARRHFDNYFELPILLYLACLIAYVLGTVNTWLLVFAWAYVFCRTIQTAIAYTTNHPIHRGIPFFVGVWLVFAMWVNLAINTLA